MQEILRSFSVTFPLAKKLVDDTYQASEIRLLENALRQDEEKHHFRPGTVLLQKTRDPGSIVRHFGIYVGNGMVLETAAGVQNGIALLTNLGFFLNETESDEVEIFEPRGTPLLAGKVGKILLRALEVLDPRTRESEQMRVLAQENWWGFSSQDDFVVSGPYGFRHHSKYHIWKNSCETLVLYVATGKINPSYVNLMRVLSKAATAVGLVTTAHYAIMKRELLKNGFRRLRTAND
jgi:hypothetical protein